MKKVGALCTQRAEHVLMYPQATLDGKQKKQPKPSVCTVVWVPHGVHFTHFMPPTGRAHALADIQATNPLYTRQSPSPTHLPHIHSVAHHQRRDSDTLRSMAAVLATSSSPTMVEAVPARRSPSNLGYSSNVAPHARHRRSPTAPEPPTTSGLIAPPGLAGNALGRSWTVGDLQESDAEPQVEETPMAIAASKSAPAMPPPPIPQQMAQVAPSKQAAMPQSAGLGRSLLVNKKAYIRLDMIGKGGSSRVYRVLDGNNGLFAVKRVSLDRTDQDAMNGYMNEIALLKRLDGNSRIIRLIDSEVREGPGGTKGHLLLVMECGEIGQYTVDSHKTVPNGMLQIFRNYYKNNRRNH